jgi:hypothetical protein
MVKKISLVLVLVLIVFCCLFVGLTYNKYLKYSKNTNEVLIRLSGKLGTQPNWESVKLNIYCDILAEGKTLDEIKSELSEITLIDVSVVDEELHYYTIYFIEPYHRIDNVGVVFDDEYRLVDKFRRVGIGDVGPIECP